MKKVNLTIKILAIISTLLTVEFTEVSAQKFRHNQIWLDLTSTFKLTNTLKSNVEIGYRVEPSEKLNQTYFRSMLFYTPQKYIKMSLWVAQYNSRRPEGSAIELRTSEFLYVSWPSIQGFKFVHRFGLDQRMFYTSGYDLSKYVHRSRYRFGLHSPYFSLFKSKPSYYVKVSFEVLKNINQQDAAIWVDHDWLSLNLGYSVNKKLSLEAHILLIHGFNPITQDFEGEISVMRLRLKFKFL